MRKTLVNPEPGIPNMDLRVLGHVVGAFDREPSSGMTLKYYNELQALDSYFRKRMEYRPGRGDHFKVDRALGALANDSTSTTATLELVARMCTLLARGDEIGRVVADALSGARTAIPDAAVVDRYREYAGAGVNMPSMVQYAAEQAARLQTETVEASQQHRAEAADARLVLQAQNAARDALRRSFQLFQRTVKTLRLERYRLFRMLGEARVVAIRPGFADIDAGADPDAMPDLWTNGSFETGVAALLPDNYSLLPEDEMEAAFFRAKLALAMPDVDFAVLRERIVELRANGWAEPEADAQGPILQTLQIVGMLEPDRRARTVERFQATLDRIMRYSEVVVSLHKKYEEAQRNMARIDLADDSEVIQWAEGVKERRTALAQARKQQILEDETRLARFLHRADPDRYEDPDAPTEAELERRAGQAAREERRRRKERLRTQGLDARDAAEMQRRKDETEAYRDYKRKKALWDARVEEAVDRLIESEKDAWREARRLAELAHAPLPDPPNKATLRSLINNTRKRDREDRFADMRAGLDGGAPMPPYMRPPEYLSTRARRGLLDGDEIRPERDWKDADKWDFRTMDAALVAEANQREFGNDVAPPADGSGEVPEEPLQAQEERLEAAAANGEASLAEMDEELEAALAFTEADMVFGASFEPGLDAAVATGKTVDGSAPPSVVDVLPGVKDDNAHLVLRMRRDSSARLPPGAASMSMLHERLEAVLDRIRSSADAADATARNFLFGRYEAETKLLAALPALVRDGPRARADMALNALNWSLWNKPLGDADDEPFTAATRLAGGWRAAYHDYVRGFMLFDVPPNGDPIGATLVEVPLTPMQWARSRFADVPYPPSRRSEIVEPAGHLEDDPPELAPLLQGERDFVKTYGPWIPYGFDFAAAKPTHALGALK